MGCQTDKEWDASLKKVNPDTKQAFDMTVCKSKRREKSAWAWVGALVGLGLVLGGLTTLAASWRDKILPGGDFESGNFSDYIEATAGSVDLTRRDAYEGQWGMRMSYERETWAIIRPVPVEGARHYRIFFHARVEATPESAGQTREKMPSWRVDFFSGAGKPLDSHAPAKPGFANADGQWHPYMDSFATPKNAEYFKLVFGNGSKGYALSVDNLSMERLAAEEDSGGDAGEIPAAGKAGRMMLPAVAGKRVAVACRLGVINSPLVFKCLSKEGDPVHLTLTACHADIPRMGTNEPTILSNAYIQVCLRQPNNLKVVFNDKYWVRPKPFFEAGDGGIQESIVGAWDKYQGATNHVLCLWIDFGESDTGFWIDGHFIGRAPLKGTGTRAWLEAQEGTFIEPISSLPLQAHSAYVPLELAGYLAKGAEQGKSDGRIQKIQDIPFSRLPVGCSLDIGRVKWTEESGRGPDGMSDRYFSRSAFDRDPDSLLLAVPNDYYSYAHVLCAVDPDPAKTSVLTLRMTRYLAGEWGGGGRGKAIADSAVTLPRGNEPLTGECSAVGTVTLATANGEQVLPLLHIEIPLRCGQIQDVLQETGIFGGRGTGYLELELTKELHWAKGNYSNYALKPLGKPSGVHVFGLTLEKSPLKINVTSRQVGNVFYAKDNPALLVEMANGGKRKFRGTLTWRTKDYYGGETASTSALSVPGLSSNVYTIDLHSLKTGWYAINLSFEDKSGRLIWQHGTTCAILPPDTREAGAESPFSTWWWSEGGHISTKSVDIVGPLLQRAGFRHIRPAGQAMTLESDLALTESDLAPYGLSLAMFPWYEQPKRLQMSLPAWVKNHPSVKYAMILHESGFGATLVYPPEFINAAVPKLNEKQETNFKALWDMAVASSAYYRKNYPDIRLIFGNTLMGTLGEFLRRGYPKELIDYAGVEGVEPVSGVPSAYGSGSPYLVKEYCKRLGYDISLAACFEWEAGVPGALIAMSYRMPRISLCQLHDSGDAYAYSYWGEGGWCHRYPLLNPKPDYLKAATLTRMLDKAEFVRVVDSSSLSLYVMEFARKGVRLYSVFTSRGERDVTFCFDRDTEVIRTDAIGTQEPITSVNKRITFKACQDVCYLASPVPVSGVEAGPTCLPATPSERALVVDESFSLEGWKVSTEPEPELHTHLLTPRCPGKFTVVNVKDEEKGDALEVTLLTQPEIPPPYARYLSLVMKTPREIPGHPTSLGLWIKGNSSWSMVMWEFVDAKGRRCFSLGRKEDPWCLYDPKGERYVNFDGWNYLALDLPSNYPGGYKTPESWNWRIEDRLPGDPEYPDLAYPLRFKRLVLTMRDEIVYINRMAPVRNPSIRIKKLTADY